MNNRALLSSEIAFKYSRALAGSCLNVLHLSVGVRQPSEFDVNRLAFGEDLRVVRHVIVLRSCRGDTPRRP